MFGQYFGDYLLKNNQITSDQFADIIEYQDNHRVKLGLIAVSEGLLSTSQAEELNRLQITHDKRFGDLAIEKKYLTEDDISHLLRLQGNPYLIFIQALEENNIMSQEDAEVIIASFQKERHFSNSDLTAIKNGDLDALIPIFVRTDDDMCHSLIGLALRNVVRFVTSHFRIENAAQVQTYKNNHIAFQKTTGDFDGFLAFASQDDSILKIANGYAKEIFDLVDEDSLDSVCEFINCINGLFATQLSHENVNIDMLPPEFKTNGFTLTADNVVVLPLYTCNKRIDILISINGNVDIQ